MNESGPQLDKLDEIVQLSILYDFYGDLLSDHKKQIFEDYILNDLSLSEIAIELNISRQGVYDIVKRCSQELKDYESRLGLVRKFEIIKKKLSNMKKISEHIGQSGDLTEIARIEALADDILKEL
ncbi:MAG TPA: sigma factor-like helix-turn-helix DNA-binding protein [Mobilitalea sp.]|nr:sigma factor-like helix-turn-helix DNA-binding protein [Mobilitalea sp.]